MKVLLIEDDKVSAAMIITLLERVGESGNVTRAANLGQGVELAQHGSFDVVILDLGLPDSEGVVTVERFRTACPHLPVVVMSGSVDKGVGERVVELGAQDFVSKLTLSASTLQRTLAFATRRHQWMATLQEARGELADMAARPFEDMKKQLTDLDRKLARLQELTRE